MSEISTNYRENKRIKPCFNDVILNNLIKISSVILKNYKISLSCKKIPKYLSDNVKGKIRYCRSFHSK